MYRIYDERHWGQLDLERARRDGPGPGLVHNARGHPIMACRIKHDMRHVAGRILLMLDTHDGCEQRR